MAKKQSKSDPSIFTQWSKNWVNPLRSAYIGRQQKFSPDIEVVVGDSLASLKRSGKSLLEGWQLKDLPEAGESKIFATAKGTLVYVQLPAKPAKSVKDSLAPTAYAQARDLLGVVFRSLDKDFLTKNVCLHFASASSDQVRGCLVALPLAHYRYKNVRKGADLKNGKLCICASKSAALKKDHQWALSVSEGVNLARHLVSLPPDDLNPDTYSKFIQDLFRGQKNIQVKKVDELEMKKRGMGLHLAVGRGAEHASCMVHIRYRPTGSKSKKPAAFVGKGITFDTGGLNMKPGNYMRLMKKDMGGSAAVVGIALAVSLQKSKQPADFYLAIAENAVSPEAFRPSDVFEASNGKTVEIHNTDAEGRLVLADALVQAVANKEKPAYVVDVATLTGAIKVGLGSDVAGLFSNDDSLTAKIVRSSHRMGDYCWRMPLYGPYFKKLSSPFADMQNCSDGYGGAITAALFLQEFVGECPWAHLDIYSWSDGAKGPLSEAGGSGQAVQSLFDMLSGAN